jgi:hypothetical protein
MVSAMRKIVMILPLFVWAAPAAAEPKPIQLPRELTDPASAQKLANAMQALSQAFLNVKVGGVEAALEGREASPQEKNMTVGDMVRRKDPDFDRHMQQQVATVGPQLQRSMRAMNEALPELVQSFKDAKKSLERAAANMPDPTYPKR